MKIDHISQATKLVKEIDSKYDEGIYRKWSRYGVDWGEWSNSFNRYLQNLYANGKPESSRYKLVFVYWSNKSKLLELNYKYKIWKRKEKKELEQILENLKNLITKTHIDFIQDIGNTVFHDKAPK